MKAKHGEATAVAMLGAPARPAIPKTLRRVHAGPVTGMVAQVLLITVAHPFPELSASELSQAIQWATAAAERKVLRGGREEVLT